MEILIGIISIIGGILLVGTITEGIYDGHKSQGWLFFAALLILIAIVAI